MWSGEKAGEFVVSVVFSVSLVPRGELQIQSLLGDGLTACGDLVCSASVVVVLRSLISTEGVGE